MVDNHLKSMEKNKGSLPRCFFLTKSQELTIQYCLQAVIQQEHKIQQEDKRPLV